MGKGFYLRGTQPVETSASYPKSRPSDKSNGRGGMRMFAGLGKMCGWIAKCSFADDGTGLHGDADRMDDVP
jgi:hypothetical protein